MITVTPADTLPQQLGTAAICVPVFGARELFMDCLRSIIAHTSPHTPILITDDCSIASEGIGSAVEEISQAPEAQHHTIFYLCQPENVGFVRNVNTAFRVLAGADVVLVNSDVRVAEGWLDRMVAAAESDSRIATVSTLTNHGSILSVPERNTPLPDFPPGCDFDNAAALVAQRAHRLYPRIPVAIGHCVLIRRSALDLVGEFDEAFSPGYGEEVDFSLRAGSRGLLHVVADDVLVFHRGRASFSEDGDKSPTQVAHDAIICERYPFYEEWIVNVASEDRGPLERALAIARTCIVRMSVTIDARCLAGAMTGTQIHALELIKALVATDEIDLRVLVPRHITPEAAQILTSIGDLEQVGEDDIGGLPRTDVAHRPYQVGHPDELLDLVKLGRRVVVTHQDLIAFNAPEYFPDYPAFAAYRSVTRDALALADFVVFFSAHAREEALRAGLTDGERTAVIHLGTDHALFGRDTAVPGDPVDGVGPTPFLLCIGTDFRHKNREFAIRVLECLIAEHGWGGQLVFAGPHVAHGSSSAKEQALLDGSPVLRDRVVDVGSVSEPSKAWLLEHASAVLYPTTIEGFGLVPFEAAQHDTPCLFAPMGSLAELFTPDDTWLAAWDAEATAATVMQLIADPDLRSTHVDGLRRAGERLQWRDAAAKLLDVYRMTIESPGAAIGTTTAVQAEYINALLDVLANYGMLDDEGNVTATPLGMAIAAPATGVPDEVKRLTLAINARPWLRKPLFGLIAAPYRLRGSRDHDDQGRS